MITHKNVLTVPEVSCYSRQEIDGGWIVRYMIRRPGETVWRPVKLFRPDACSTGADAPVEQPERVISAMGDDSA
jgi:hypothetical protein